MYDSVEELRTLQFELHAVMVHEGSIDSGHYWAYVRDHARKVNPAVWAHSIRARSEHQIQSNIFTIRKRWDFECHWNSFGPFKIQTLSVFKPPLYSGDLNNGLLYYSNGPNLSDHGMVR